MDGIRFYAEYPDAHTRRQRGIASNVVAMLTGPEHRCSDGSQEALCAVFDWPNAPVNLSAVSFEYLRTRCKRISEAEARKIHPEMFKRLDEK